MKIDRYDLALVNATCGETTRPMLQCLHFTKGRVEAADGFMLVVRDLDLQEDEDKPEALINFKMIKKIKPERRQEIFLAITDSKATVNYRKETGEPAEYEPSISFATYKDGKLFPDTDQLWTTAEKKTQIAVGVGLLKKLLAIMPNEGILRIGITEPTAPIEFVCSNMGRPIRGMLMPMFVDWGEHSWHGKVEENKKGDGRK